MSTFFVKLKPAKTHTCSPLLSPKQIGTVCFAIFSILISAPLFATGVSSGATSADCDNATLDTYSGTSNLQVDWQPNNIALHWYNGDAEITSGVQTSCVYDGTLTPPTTIPTKTGYTFKGWRVKQTDTSCFASQVCGLTGNAVNGLTYNIDSNAYGYYSNDGQQTYNTGTYGLAAGGWAVKDTNGGIIKGVASCNSTKPDLWDTVKNGMIAGTMTEEQMVNTLWGTCNTDTFRPSNTFNSSSTGQNSWCKIESYKPNSGSVCNVVSPSWVFYSEDVSVADCVYDCVSLCAYFVVNYPVFRRAVFGVSQ